MKKTISLLLLSALILSGCSANSTQSPKDQTISGQESSRPVFIMAGKVEAGEKVDVGSKITGRVSELKIDVGSVVNKGDVLISLDTREIDAQIKQAEAGVNTANANLAKIQAGARPEQKTQAKAQVDSTAAAYENAKLNYERTSQLFEAGAVSNQALEAAEAQKKTTEAQYVSAQSQYDILISGETKETLSVAEAQVEQAKAALDAANTQLVNASIVAPISGVVCSKNISAGELAIAGTTLLTIVNSDSLYINANLPAKLCAEVTQGQEVAISLFEIPGKLFDGKITTVDEIIDSKNKSIFVKAKLAETDPAIKVGMLAEIALKK